MTKKLATTEVKALVTLTVAPKEGQPVAEAGPEMLRLFTEYITERESNLLNDYGATEEDLIAYWQDPEGTEPTWGGYEGPFVLSATVRDVAEPVTQGAAWHRAMGDTYARIALESNVPAAKTANAAEAAKYYAIAERLAAAESRSE